MLKKIVLVGVIIAFVGCAAGCSSSGKIGEACDLVYTKITSACDLTDTAEATIVALSLSGFYGEEITVTDVMEASKSDFTNDCVTGYEEETDSLTNEIRDALVDAQMQAVNAITTTDCGTMMASLGAALGAI